MDTGGEGERGYQAKNNPCRLSGRQPQEGDEAVEEGVDS